MSASSTSSSTSCSQEDGEPGTGGGVKRSTDTDEADSSTLKKRMQQYGSIVGYANSSMSTLDRSQYHSLPLNGTRRVTVQFGRMKIVVPWKESDSTVGQLAEAALLRYKKAKGMILAITDEANGGSSTPTYTPIQKHQNHHHHHHQQHHYAQPLPYSRKPDGPTTPIASAFGSVSVNHQAHRSASPYNVGYATRGSSRDAPPPLPPKDRRNSVVEVNSFDEVPQSGLRVSTSTPKAEPILRSSLRTEASGSRPAEEATPTKQPRVTLSPEVEKKLAEQEGGDERKSERRRHYEKNPGRFNRGSDRKSRINDALLDARDRIVEQIEAEPEKSSKRTTRGKLEMGHEEGTTIVTFPVLDESESVEARQMGIEVIAVLEDDSIPSTSHQTSKLIGVEVTKIEEGGRIARDGRIRVGDCIREINGRPVNQMSMIRARAYLADLSEATRDVTLLINRSIESFLEQEAAASDAKPIQSALQQANTQYIGHTTIVELIKSSTGFGFTVTGRETSKGERLFYIGTVKPHGVALGHLKSGDRLLEINGESTGQFTQAEIVEKLKETMVGAKIRFLVSRVSQQQTTSSGNTSTSSQNKENEDVGAQKTFETPSEVQKLPLPALLTPPVQVPKETLASPSSPASTRFDLAIPVNGSGSAGLGVSLKARVSKKSDGSKKDCGIFIKNVMHGGAAFKEGRLRVDDRIVGVEDVDLESMSNTDASHALAKKLKEIGPTSSHVKLTIVRTDEDRHAGPISRDSSRITVDAPSPAPSSRMSSQTAPSSIFLQSPQNRATSSSGVESSQHSRQSSSASSSGPPIMPLKPTNERDSIVSDLTRLDESEMPDTDPFDREAPGRKSLSEKRGMGAAADPQHIKLFQEIKHQRQNSAPTSSTQKRSKSQPRSLSQRNYRSPMKLVELPQSPASATMPRQQPQSQDESDMLNRRSQSMESINRPVESILRGTGTGQKVQFMQTSDQQHPFPPGSTALMRLKSEESRSRDKSRRKSVGNVMRNFFKFGSKSREASPEKTPIRPPIHEESRPKNTVPQHQAPPPPPPPHLQAIRRGSAGGIYVDYGEPYGLIPQYPHNTSQTLASSAQDGIRLISYSKNASPPPYSSLLMDHKSLQHVGNSRFYSSYREQPVTQRPRLPDTSRTPTLSSTTATPHIGTSEARTTTSTDSRAAPRSTRRPMSTTEHLIRSMSMPEYHPQHRAPQSAEVLRRPRCVVPIPTSTTTRPPTSTSPQQPGIGKAAPPADAATTITCSTRGSHTLGAEQRAPRPSSSPRTVPDRRFASSQPRLFETNATPSQRHHHQRQPLQPLRDPIAVGASRPEQSPPALPVLMAPRRRSMRMLDLEDNSNSHPVARPDSLFLDTAADSLRRRSPPTSAAPPPTTASQGPTTRQHEDPRARRANTAGNLIVFPSTRFPIASASVRVSSAPKLPNSTSVTLRSVTNNNNYINNGTGSSSTSSPANERMSLRARKKLHREAVTRSEFYTSPYSNENIRLFNSYLLPPSTSSIMTTTPTNH